MGLRGRVAIVTGASKGIGRAIAISLADEGARVFICARGAESLAEAEAEIRRRGGQVVAIQADATDPTAVQRVIATATGQGKGLDILVNNVGGAGRFGGFAELTDAEWREAFELNVMSVVYFVRYATPWLRRSASPRIINISSISGVQPGAYNPHYTCVKAAVINLGKHLANEFAKDRILVNTVCPGPVHGHSWDMNVERLANIRGLSVEQAAAAVETEEAKKIPLGRIGEGADVASLVTFLASDQAQWITGSCFHVNGGKLRSIC